MYTEIINLPKEGELSGLFESTEYCSPTAQSSGIYLSCL